ncbi:MAG: FkbM family methyltransferase [Bryobacteraceae bacterium]
MNPLLKESIRRLLPRTLAMRRIWIGPLRGHRIYTSWHDYPGALLGTTERPLLDWFARNVLPGETWLDVGGHYGYTSLALSKLVGPEGRVFCFEPVTASADCIARTMTAEGARNVRTVPLGLSDSAHRRTLELPSIRGMADSTLGNSVPPVTIELIALDSIWPSLCENDARIHGVKIDVQGLEFAVLHGMRKALSDHHPRLVVEFHRGVERAPIHRFLAECGYGLPATDLAGAPAVHIADDTSYVFLTGSN